MSDQNLSANSNQNFTDCYQNLNDCNQNFNECYQNSNDSYQSLNDSCQNLNDSNQNLNNVPKKDLPSDLQESINEEQKSQILQEYEINKELEELRNKIRQEIAKREQSNLKHNILYIPSLEKNTKEQISPEILLINEKVPAAENSHLPFENTYDCKCDRGDGHKGMTIVLKSLLKNKLSITEAIHKLTCVEDILKCKIKFRENLDSIAFDLKANQKTFDDNNVVFYRQQWRKVVTELNELKNVLISVDLKINTQMLDANISPNDNEYLKHSIELKTSQCEFLVKHINHIKEVFREEIDVKNKFIHIMAQMLEMSNSVLRSNSLLTQQMSNSYSNMIQTAQGLGINDFSRRL